MTVVVFVAVWARELCKALATYMAQSKEGKINHDGLSDKALERYFLGFMGEVAFGQWLECEKIPYVYRALIGPPPHKPEFVVAGYTIDAKALSVAQDQDMVIGETRDTSADIFVVARQVISPGGKAWEIAGWYWRAQVLDTPADGRRYGSKVRELALGPSNKMDALVGVLRKGKAS